MNCAHEGCYEPRSGKSKYCVTHKAEARARWKAMIAEQENEKQERYAKFKRAWNKALEAGQQAGSACVPVPMVVSQHTNMLDDNSPVEKRWHVPDGACGFAWVKVPGNTSFAHWAKKNADWSGGGIGGCRYWVGQFGQSYERKDAFARAAAQVLRDELGIKAYSEARLD